MNDILNGTNKVFEGAVKFGFAVGLAIVLAWTNSIDKRLDALEKMPSTYVCQNDLLVTKRDILETVKLIKESIDTRLDRINLIFDQLNLKLEQIRLSNMRKTEVK